MEAVDLYRQLLTTHPDRMTSPGWSVRWHEYTLLTDDTHINHINWAVNYRNRHVVGGHANKTSHGHSAVETAWLAACQAVIDHLADG